MIENLISDLPWSLLAVGMALCLLTLFVGHIFQCCDDLPAIDRRIGLGALVLAACVAMVFTKMQTVYLPVVVFFIHMIIMQHKRLKAHIFNIRDYGPDVLVLLCYFLLVFALQVWVNYRGKGEWAIGYIDNYAYISQINLMYAKGIETRFLELEKSFYGFEPTLKPYHYFESWPAVFAKWLSGSLGYLVYHLFLIPYLAAIMLYQNFRILYRHFNKNIWFSAIIPLAVFSTLRYVMLDEWLFHWLSKSGHQYDVSRFVFFSELWKLALFFIYVWHENARGGHIYHTTDVLCIQKSK